ncbi:transcription initiation factor IID, 31kD subunit-domain-containing protein [Astrocystis sublimbata]|nr:transcription initiation factor IID, 31kD subunit-domain-containing protein [Astrocystis sublimbata]
MGETSKIVSDAVTVTVTADTTHHGLNRANNGVPPPSSAGPSQSQPQPASQPSATQNTATSGSTTMPNTQATNTTPAPAAQTAAAPTSPTATSAEPRPRDARTIELLLTSQGVTSFDNRVPLLLLDFAYRHTSSILNDALHLSGDPYSSHAGAKPSGSTNAIHIAIASRQTYQFRGGSGGGGAGGGGGGASKEWLQELARERNKVALPRILANEWGVRLPNERFVLSGQAWGLRDQWENDDDSDAMEGLERAEGQRRQRWQEDGEQEGGLDEFLGDDLGDEDMDMDMGE